MKNSDIRKRKNFIGELDRFNQEVVSKKFDLKKIYDNKYIVNYARKNNWVVSRLRKCIDHMSAIIRSRALKVKKEMEKRPEISEETREKMTKLSTPNIENGKNGNRCK
jgi:hypothetical protein